MEMHLQGVVGIDQVNELRQNLLNALQTAKEVTLSFAKVEGVDLSFFQLLHAANRAFRNRGIVFKTLADLPRQFAFQAEVSGWSGIVKAEDGKGGI